MKLNIYSPPKHPCSGANMYEHLSFREGKGPAIQPTAFKVPHNWAKHAEMLVFEPWLQTWVLGHRAGDRFLGRQKITWLLGEENPLKNKMEPKNIILNLKRKVIYLNRTSVFWGSMAC